jgi:hypothetical protein
VFAEVRSAVAVLKQVAHELDPLQFDGPGAATLLEDVADGERICVAIKALLARRVDECGTWKQSGHQNAAQWLAARTGVTVPAATRALETAHDLDALPETAEAFRAGEISEVQAHAITEAARMDPSAQGALLAAAAQRSTVEGLRQKCRKVRATARADDAAWARDMHVRRSLREWTDRDGMRCGQYRLPPDDGAKFSTAIRDHHDRIFKAAYQAGRRERHEAFAADALIALAEQGPCKPIQLKGSFAIEALDRGYAEPGEDVRIDGFGPIPVTVARRLAVDSVVSFNTTKGDDIHSVSSAKRTVPARIRRALELRDTKCSNPSCSNDGHLEMDHVDEYSAGGPTSLDNLALFCPTCHDLKTYSGWRLTGPPGNRRFGPPDADHDHQPGDRVLELIAPGPP